MDRKFSVGIPAFKSRFLNDCIGSILNQTYRDFELIIVNDASPEPVEQVVKTFSDGRIKYFRNERNTGAENVVDNWNKCLEKATGEFFVLMGDDDTMEPTYLEEFAALVGRYPLLDVYHCRCRLIDEHSRPIGITPSWPEYESVYDNILHRYGYGRIQFISDFVYRASVLKANNGFYKLPLAWASDDISSFIAMGDKGIAHVNKPLLNYRKSAITISSSGNIDLKMKAVMEMGRWLEEFLNKQPSGETDRIVHDNLKKDFKWYVKKRKREVMMQSMEAKGVMDSWRWFRHRKRYNLTGKDIVLSYFGKV
jgi:glycosyltransferase involved in cell wall biosynthesis